MIHSLFRTLSLGAGPAKHAREITLRSPKNNRRARGVQPRPVDPVLLLPPLPKSFSREQAIAELDNLYSQLPNITCKGLCHDSCGVIAASELEYQRIGNAGASIGPRMSDPGFRQARSDTGGWCPALGPVRNCTIYPIRPFICRAYGLGAGLRCQHGCVPDRIVPDVELWNIMARIEQLSRHVTGVRSWPAEQPPAVN